MNNNISSKKIFNKVIIIAYLSLSIVILIVLLAKVNFKKDAIKAGEWARKFAKESNYILKQGYGSDKLHSDIKSLVDANDCVIIGTIEKIDDTREGRMIKKDGTVGGKEAPGYVDLVVEVKVEEVFKGNITKGGTIKVYQRLGYIFGEVFTVNGDVKEYSENEQYAFFLCDYKGKDGYIVYNATQGQIFIGNLSDVGLNKIQKDDYVINVDRNKFAMFNEKITKGQLRECLN